MRNELAIMILRENREDVLNTLAPETNLRGSIKTIDYAVALSKGIASLERDIEKPLKAAITIGNYNDYVMGCCPNCGTVMVEQLSAAHGYCRKCGQKLEWKEKL